MQGRGADRESRLADTRVRCLRYRFARESGKFAGYCLVLGLALSAAPVSTHVDAAEKGRGAQKALSNSDVADVRTSLRIATCNTLRDRPFRSFSRSDIVF